MAVVDVLAVLAVLAGISCNGCMCRIGFFGCTSGDGSLAVLAEPAALAVLT